MAQALHFADLALQNITQEMAPALNRARMRGDPHITLSYINEKMKEWWKILEKSVDFRSLSLEKSQVVQDEFLKKVDENAAFTSELVDAALMQAYFKAFKENNALPASRAEVVVDIPNDMNTPPKITSIERLSGADVVPFLRGRLFGVLGKTGLSARADILTLTALIDELLTEPEDDDLVNAINIEPASMLDATFMDELELQVKRLNSKHAARLCLEVTERGREQLTKERIDQLCNLRRSVGFRIAYDDYTGAIHEDMQLAMMQPDSVKVDGHIIKSLLVEVNDDETRRKNEEIVFELLRRIARNAPFAKTVAEWAETLEAYKSVATIGFDSVQSFMLMKGKVSIK